MKNVPGRLFRAIDLNGEWEFLCAAAGADRLPDVRKYPESVTVPGYWKERPEVFFAVNGPGGRGISDRDLAPTGVGFYRRRVEVGPFRKATLTAGPLLPCGAVFCNGRPAGTQCGGLTAAEFDLSGLLVPDSVNEIVIAVRGPPPEEDGIAGAMKHFGLI